MYACSLYVYTHVSFRFLDILKKMNEKVNLSAAISHVLCLW